MDGVRDPPEEELQCHVPLAVAEAQPPVAAVDDAAGQPLLRGVRQFPGIDRMIGPYLRIADRRPTARTAQDRDQPCQHKNTAAHADSSCLCTCSSVHPHDASPAGIVNARRRVEPEWKQESRCE